MHGQDSLHETFARSLHGALHQPELQPLERCDAKGNKSPSGPSSLQHLFAIVSAWQGWQGEMGKEEKGNSEVIRDPLLHVTHLNNQS